MFFRSAHVGEKSSYEVSEQVLKVFMYVILFCIILVCGLITPATLFFASSNVYDNNEAVLWNNQPFPLTCLDYKMFSNKTTSIYSNQTNCVAIPPTYYDNNKTLTCLRPNNDSGKVEITGPEDGYLGSMCIYSLAQWVWCLLLMQCTPQFFKFVRCLWYTMFNHKPMPAVNALVIVSLYHCLLFVKIVYPYYLTWVTL